MVPNNIIKGVVIGGLVGAGFGILFAPKSGKQTREQIRNSAQGVLEKAKTQYDEVSGKLEQLTSHNKEIFAEKKDRLKKALDAGIEAYTQAKPQTGCMTGLYGDNSLL